VQPSRVTTSFSICPLTGILFALFSDLQSGTSVKVGNVGIPAGTAVSSPRSWSSPDVPLWHARPQSNKLEGILR
jgi:hypothetical protein